MYGEFLSPQISDVKIYLLKYETLAREFLIMDIIGHNFFPDQKKSFKILGIYTSHYIPP